EFAGRKVQWTGDRTDDRVVAAVGRRQKVEPVVEDQLEFGLLQELEGMLSKSRQRRRHCQIDLHSRGLFKKARGTARGDSGAYSEDQSPFPSLGEQRRNGSHDELFYVRSPVMRGNQAAVSVDHNLGLSTRGPDQLHVLVEPSELLEAGDVRQCPIQHIQFDVFS